MRVPTMAPPPSATRCGQLSVLASLRPSSWTVTLASGFLGPKMSLHCPLLFYGFTGMPAKGLQRERDVCTRELGGASAILAHQRGENRLVLFVCTSIAPSGFEVLAH